MRLKCIVTFLVAAALAAATLAEPVGNTDRFAPARRLENLPGLANVGVVDSGLLRGAAPGKQGFATLKALGVRTVVNLRHYHSRTEERRCREAGLDYIWLPLESSDAPSDSSIRRFLALATDPARRPLYYHCWRGKDRTGTMTAVYRMAVQDWPLDRALTEMTAFGLWRGWFDLRSFTESFSGRRAEFRTPRRPTDTEEER